MDGKWTEKIGQTGHMFYKKLAGGEFKDSKKRRHPFLLHCFTFTWFKKVTKQVHNSNKQNTTTTAWKPATKI